MILCRESDLENKIATEFEIFVLNDNPLHTIKLIPESDPLHRYEIPTEILKSVKPFERILRALFTSQCPYKFSSFLDLRNASNRFRLFPRDFRLFRFFFPGSACYSTLASPQNLPSWVKHYGKFESFGKEFRRTKFIAVERVICFFYVETHKVFTSKQGGFHILLHKSWHEQVNSARPSCTAPEQVRKRSDSGWN